MAVDVFTDDFVGTNGDSWNATKWPTISTEGTANTTVDIQSNTGHFKCGTAADDFFSANANHSDLGDSDGLIMIDPVSLGGTQTHNQWLYVIMRSSGEQSAAAAGRPQNGCYFRFKLGTDQTGTNDNLYNRINNVESNPALVSGINAAEGIHNQLRTAGSKFWFRWEIRDQSPNVFYRWKIWDDGDTEPVDEWVEYTDTDGGLIGEVGITQLVGRNFQGGDNVEGAVEEITITDPDATPPAAGDDATGAFVAMIMQAA